MIHLTVGEILESNPFHLFLIWLLPMLLFLPLSFCHPFCVCLPYPLDLFPPSVDYSFASSIQSILNLDALLALASVYSYDTSLHTLAYKPVAKKIHAILAPLDKEFHITQSLLDNLLTGLKPLPSHPPDFIPGVHSTQECADNLDLDPTNWLWLDKAKLIRWIVLGHEMAFAWVPTKCGHLNEWYFPPVKIRNIPIPPSMWADTIHIIKDQIASGVYEPSAAAYQSH